MISAFRRYLDTWVVRHIEPGDSYSHLTGITYANGVFVAVGYKGVILSSPDGVSWTRQTNGVALDLSFKDVMFGGGQFVAIAPYLESPFASPASAILTSPP